MIEFTKEKDERPDPKRSETVATDKSVHEVLRKALDCCDDADAGNGRRAADGVERHAPPRRARREGLILGYHKIQLEEAREMAVIAKFICIEKTDQFNQWSNPTGKTQSRVKLGVANGPDNKTWAKYTPAGTLEMTIDNPDAFDMFKLGQAYRVTFTEVPFAESEEQQ